VIDAVVFDLDDTLFDQRVWLAGAWRAVAAVGTRHRLDEADLHDALVEVAALGSARGRIIDRALARVGGADLEVTPFLDAFRAHRPARLPLYPGVADALADLRRRVLLGLVTDGDPVVQRSKLAALAIDDVFDAVVLSDELGRDRRKPHPAPFRAVLDLLGVDAARAVFVGDRPDKDVAGARAVGMRALRVSTGEYAGAPDVPRPWLRVADVRAAVDALAPSLGRASGMSVL
jgi:putative hydrolase of the HAD superfamily